MSSLLASSAAKHSRAVFQQDMAIAFLLWIMLAGACVMIANAWAASVLN